MTTLKVNTISGIGNTEGTVFKGGVGYDSLNYMTLPKGTTAQRVSSRGRAVIPGGYNPAGSPNAAKSVNTIEYLEINTTANALDFGDLSFGSASGGSCGSSTRGLIGGSYISPGIANSLNNIDFMVRDMNKINYPNKYFDCIVDTQSIYYSKDYLKTFNHLRKILSDNGILITIPGIGEKDLIKQYINQIQNAGFSIINFKFIETINLGEKEYLPTITCNLKKPKENINIDHVINKLFN